MRALLRVFIVHFLSLLLLQDVDSVTIIEEGDEYKIEFSHGSGGRLNGTEATNPFYCGGNVVNWKIGAFNSTFHAVIKVEGTAFPQYFIESIIVDEGVSATTTSVVRNLTEGPFDVGQLFDDTNTTGYYLIDERFVYETPGVFKRSWSVRVKGVIRNETLFTQGGTDYVLIEEDGCIDEYVRPTASPTAASDNNTSGGGQRNIASLKLALGALFLGIII